MSSGLRQASDWEDVRKCFRPVLVLVENYDLGKGQKMGSVVKKRRKRMAKKKHKKLLKKTRIQRRNAK